MTDTTIEHAHSIDKLARKAAENGPVCVGLDTTPAYIPENILASFEHPSIAVLAYNRAIIERITRDAACCKVQIAYYEALGLAGLKTYSETLRLVRQAGLPVIADIKRGDIADTAKAYAKAHLSHGADFEADIITVNPYMGFDTLEPFLDYTDVNRSDVKNENGAKGLFVLLRTSNKGMSDIEGQILRDGRHVFELTGDALQNIAAHYSGTQCALSPVGAVVGCTEAQDAAQIRDRFSNIFFLIPGYGAQGGDANIAKILLKNPLAASGGAELRYGGVVNSSRGILCAWKTDNSLTAKREKNALTLDDIADAALRATQKAKAELE
ncbi:MAG: orotidine-5'-phosphate decarboxylase [Treponemataceae bacterium]|nr:MAG: orotidine-5'-phosphate decarboxylase [Treponemataceae bacterium]